VKIGSTEEEWKSMFLVASVIVGQLHLLR